MDTLFDYEEPSTTCAHCGRPLRQGTCQWCDRQALVDSLNTPAKRIVRASGPETSRVAAQVASMRSGTQKHRILVQYGIAGESGLTDEDVAGILGEVEVNKVRKRCSDLRNDLLIEPTGETRDGKSQMPNAVHRITIKGVALLGTMKEPHAPASDPDHSDYPECPHGYDQRPGHWCPLCVPVGPYEYRAQ